MRRMIVAPALLALLLNACGEPPPLPPPPVTDEDVPPTVDDQMLQVPPGGYEDWLGDIREGVQVVLTQASEDRGAALDALRQLYESRYSHLQAFYGEGGSHVSGSMAPAVEQLGAELQELMRQLTSDEVAQEIIRERVQATDEAIQRVLTEGRAAGVPNAPPQ